MRVYDFDKTIYQGDSSLDFYLFALRRHPLLLRYLPLQCFGVCLYMLRVVSKTRGKEFFFSFLRGLRDAEAEVQHFWRVHCQKMASWYLCQKRDDDVVVSASPEFLLGPQCKNLSVRLIGSLVDASSGTFLRKNCYGEEKVVRFYEHFPHESIEEFYSDSFSDAPMAKIAEKSFIVKQKTSGHPEIYEI